jgi:hypothetical protein
MKKEANIEENDDKSSSNVLDSNSDRDDGNNSNDDILEIDSGILHKRRMEEIFRLEMR